MNLTNQFLANPELSFIIFGGKGGSGKTTCACATALYFAQKYKNKKILVVSTDPAPSIGDSFDIEVGNKLTRIKDSVWAQELDAKELMEDFREKHLETVKTLVERGTFLDGEDIEEFASLSAPGMDEVMAVTKIADLLKTGEFDLIILDTAPTGHTKVLLSLPKTMKRWLKVADLMMAKHRFMVRRIRGKYNKDECDKFLEDTMADIERVEDLLKNYESTEFVPVTIPESVSILEVESLIKDLQSLRIKVKSLIVNRVIMVEENGVPVGTRLGTECPLCTLKMKEKEKYLKMVEEKFKNYQIFKMPLFPSEIRGQNSLNEYARILFGEEEFKSVLPRVLEKFPEIPQGKMAEFLEKDLNFVICGGKGGVGKTSIAAATAMAFAKRYKDKKILVTTTDPAHALSNIFDQDILLDTNPVSIPYGAGNLFAVEIDAHKKLQDFKEEYKKDIEELFEKFTGPGMDVVYDTQVLKELLDLSPPGLEELMALGEIMDLIKENKYDIYVLDSAASGHLLRFLELPNLARDWLKSIFKILRKYQGFKLESIAQKMVDLSKDVRKIQEILFSSSKTEFIMITIAEEMGIRVTGNLALSLEKLNVNYNYIIANFINPVRDYRGKKEIQREQISNGVNPVSECNFCLAKRKDQEKYLKIIKKQYPSKRLILVPLLAHDIKGIESLKELAMMIYGT